MGQGEKLPHGLVQLLPVRPEGEAEIGVKAEDGARLPCGSDGSQMGVAHGAVHQRDTAKMQGKGLREPARVDLLRGVQQVCGGLAAEAEGALAVFCQTDEGQRGAGFAGKFQMGELYAASGQHPGNFVAKGVIAQLAQQRTAAAQPGNGGADIGRSAAHPGAEGGHLVKAAPHPGGDHIDQRFADGK